MDLNELIKMTIPGAKLLSVNNGDLEVRVEDEDEIGAVLAAVAEAYYDYDLGDVQITTSRDKLKVWIREIEEEED